MQETDFTQIRAVIEGRVQGVGFRYFVYEKAVGMGIVGWVRNTFDEKVEITAEGSRSDLSMFLDYVSRGPTIAFISRVNVEWHPSTGSFNSFKIEHTN